MAEWKRNPRLPARGDGGSVAAAQRDRLNLVVGDDDEARAVVLAGAHHFQVGDGRVRVKHLDLLDDDGGDAAHRVVRLRVDGPDDFALVCNVSIRLLSQWHLRDIETGSLDEMDPQAPTLTCSDDENVVGFPVSRPHLRIHGQLGELVAERRVRQERDPVEGRDGLVHQRVRLDEIQRHFGQRPRIVDALPRARFRHVVGADRQPIGIHRRLLLFKPIKS